jgi:RNA polymerase sigma-70 factor (ECF subfamily)
MRNSLRAKFDSVDVVQSVWAELLKGIQEGSWQFNDRAHLQAFLVRLAKNRFLDYCRKHRNATKHELSLTDGDAAHLVARHAPRPSELARRDELWEKLLALCPPNHHDLLRMKLDGLSVAEIADRTGLHGGSVRRILSELARRVASAPAPTTSLVELSR